VTCRFAAEHLGQAGDIDVQLPTLAYRLQALACSSNGATALRSAANAGSVMFTAKRRG